ncbi:MAG: hypothetical protein JWP81_1019 [Ferruginibacter sp.]|nr:hypothetical protein [Ferruginibacter sp.]
MSLDAQQQRIVSLSALTAVGDLEHLKTELNTGLDAGLTCNEIKEVMVQLYAYCGFPRTLNGINTFMQVLEQRKAKGIKDKEGRDASPITDTVNKYQIGKKTLQTLTGKEEKTLSGANAFAPVLDTFLKEHLFADIFSRDILNFEQRELTTVSALAAMSGVKSQLQAHMAMGINTGLTEAQLRQIVSLIKKHIGEQQADLARNVLNAVTTKKE